MTAVSAGGKASAAVGTGTANGERTEAGAAGTGAEPGAGIVATESGVGGLLRGLLGPRCPVWPHLCLSGQAAAG